MKRIIKKLFATAILFSFISFFAVTAVYAATNLITNPEFTTDLNGWGWNATRTTPTRRDFSVSPNIAPTGGINNFGVEIQTNTTDGSISQAVSSTTGQWYLAKARAYSPSSNTGVNNATIVLADSGSNTLNETRTISEDSWQTLATSARAADTSTRLFLRDQTVTNGDKSYLDAASLELLSFSDMLSQVTSTTTSDVNVVVSIASSPRTTQAGLALNLDSSTNPQNGVFIYHDGTRVKVEKLVSGTYTSVASPTTTFVANAGLQVRKSGTSYAVYYNQTLVNTYTISDAGIINNTIQARFNTYSGNSMSGLTFLSSNTIYIDPGCSNNGNGAGQDCANSAGETGAYNSFAEINTLAGNLDNAQILIKRGSSIESSISLQGASNFTIDAYGSGAKPIISAARTFNATWTQEGSLWYTAVQSGKNYSRGFIVNGRKLDGVSSKSDLNSGQYKSWYDSGSSRHYIVLDGVVNPNSATIQANSQDALRAIYCYQCNNARISNLYLQYSYDNNISLLETGNNIEISNITSVGAGAWHSDYGADGITVYGVGNGTGSVTPATGVVIKNNISNGNQNNGIEVWGLNGVTVSDNSMDGNGGGIEVWGNITNSNFTRNTALNNTLPQTATASQNVGRGFWAAPTSQDVPDTGFNSNNTVSYNIFGTSYTVGAKIDQGAGWKFYNNIIYEVTRTGQYVVDVRNSGTSVEFTNNIIANAHGNDPTNYFLARFGASSSEITLTGNNNDFYAFNGGASTFNPIYINGTQYDSFSSFKTASGQTNSLNVDPLFVVLSTPDFHLQSSSSLINSGANVGLTQAIDGSSVPQGSAPDIGAYEYTTPGSNNAPSSSSPSAPGCNDSAPTGVPDLFQIDTKGTSATLYFAPVAGSVSNYYVAYGLTSGIYLYGSDFSVAPTGGVLSYTINQLAPNTTYFFKLRSGNGCAAGQWGNEMSAKSGLANGLQIIKYYKNTASPTVSSSSKTIKKPQLVKQQKTQPSPSLSPSPSLAPVADNSPQNTPSPQSTSSQQPNMFENVVSWIKGLF